MGRGSGCGDVRGRVTVRAIRTPTNLPHQGGVYRRLSPPPRRPLRPILEQDAGWRRVRPPLVALDEAELARIEAQMAAFGLDRSQD